MTCSTTLCEYKERTFQSEVLEDSEVRETAEFSVVKEKWRVDRRRDIELNKRRRSSSCRKGWNYVLFNVR